MATDADAGPLARAVLESILESSDDAIIGEDLNGINTRWNAAATHIFGYAAHEMLLQSQHFLGLLKSAMDATISLDAPQNAPGDTLTLFLPRHKPVGILKALHLIKRYP